MSEVEKFNKYIDAGYGVDGPGLAGPTAKPGLAPVVFPIRRRDGTGGAGRKRQRRGRPHPGRIRERALPCRARRRSPGCPHRRCKGDAHQQPFRSDETADGLAPWFLPVPDQQPIPSRFEFRRRRFDALDVELDPACGMGTSPGHLRAEARLRRLGEWPQGKVLAPRRALRMEIAAVLFPERDGEGPAVEVPACPHPGRWGRSPR